MGNSPLSHLLSKMDLISASAPNIPTYHGVFKAIVFLLALSNLKNLLGVWHYRVFRTFFARFANRPKRPVDPTCLFLPVISRTHAPLLETDFNMHKSNSTYLSDIDISRANAAVLLFDGHVATSPWSTKPKLMLGGVQIIWRKEIKPYTDYEVWTRVLSWGDKWFYTVTHFVQKGAFKPALYLQNEKLSTEEADKLAHQSADKAKEMRELHARKIYASAISRVVVKQGREVIKPADLLAQAGMLPTDVAGLAKVEERRSRNLSLVEEGGAWEGLHATFFDSAGLALGRYTDLLFR